MSHGWKVKHSSTYRNCWYELGFPGGSRGKESGCSAGDPGSIPGSQRSPGEGNGYPWGLLPGESHRQRSLAGYSPWGRKESDTPERLTLSNSIQSTLYKDILEQLMPWWPETTMAGWLAGQTKKSDSYRSECVLMEGRRTGRPHQNRWTVACTRADKFFYEEQIVFYALQIL